ncbi:hypothetical protein AC812_05610 [Bellilinea caldifistulae]|uniref:Uncharacterized protein n=1 Tax=Bellilinea caldifistulae TaxID=360411 RepID=A0A0P6XKV5_9CHLR|nr:hypothetical protein AC812_05610 [Bellilinea caldifistulae]
MGWGREKVLPYYYIVKNVRHPSGLIQVKDRKLLLIFKKDGLRVGYVSKRPYKQSVNLLEISIFFP